MKRSQYTRALRDARVHHDARFKVDNPPPTLETVTAHNAHLERAVAWLVVLLWVVLAVAGTGMSYPHTIKTLETTVDATRYPWFPYVAFAGVELGAIMIAFAAALKSYEVGDQARKVASLRGALRRLVMRAGFNPNRWKALSIEHLPDRAPSTGGALALASLFAMVVFNLRDTLDLPPLAELSQVVAGLAGPVLVYVAGHRFAHEIVKASKRGRHERLAEAQAQWDEALQASWDEQGETWVREIMRVQGVQPLFDERVEQTGGTGERPGAVQGTFGERSERENGGGERSGGVQGTFNEQVNAPGERSGAVKAVPKNVHELVNILRERPCTPLSDLADELNVSRTTVHNRAKRGVDSGLLFQDEQGRYYAPNGHG